ncbi:exodeoxyribonuclease III [Desulfonema magnum]|uniref:Exodeoxyribonuclease n=1 Tax=Desulfonema magnum TaxID=45655 RepID=A0A975BWQ9_9BACT|nr:exodeoxyribonuclease III [Desulfonema magnum]QTA92767.1 Exodeoxyribonuclease [Desulfonema magnum]
MSEKLKLISWNVNGLRAAVNKDFFNSFKTLDADIFAIQETKLQEHQLTHEMKHIDGYESFWSHSSVKKGYSGVGVYTKIKPQYVRHGIGIPEYDNEGRILELGFKDFVFFNIYFPNGQMSEERLQYKLDFYRDFFEYADTYKKAGQCLIITGDYNTAHNEIDLKNPKPNEKYSGFLRIERDWLDKIIENGYTDTFRHFHPDTVKYSWWSYRFKARERNAGWRIDYFFVSENMADNGQIQDAFIDNEIYGSDHCPVGLVITT